MKQKGEFPLALKLALEETIRLYQNPKFIQTDPIAFPHQYQNTFDIEIVSLLSCLYAYGNVKAIQNFLRPLLEKLGPSPYVSLANQTKDFEKCYNEIGYYRFQSRADNQLLLLSLSSILNNHNIETKGNPIFESYFLLNSNEFEPAASISQFQERMEISIKTSSKQKPLSRGLRFLIGDPAAKSAKKRICLFLRWMVRRKFPDFGLYRQIDPKDLAFPLDVHIQRLIQILGISDRKTFQMREGILVRDFFQMLNPIDPLLYDFYLTRVGMIQKCQGKKIESVCSQCSLKEVCLIGSATGN